ISSNGATTGQTLIFNGATLAWGNPVIGGTAGGDLTGTYPNPTVANNAITTSKILDANVTTAKIADASVTTPKIADAAVTPIKLSSTGATTGQALTFNGTNIVWGAPTLSGTAGGDLTGTYPNPTVANNAITTTKILDANVTTAKIADAAITASKLNQMAATNGQVLTWNGTTWAPAAAGGTGTVTSVNVSGGTTGLTASGGPVTSSGTITLGGTLALANGGTGATTAAGARTNLGLGTLATLNTVTSAEITDGTITAADLNQMGAADGQVLTWNGTTWAPANDNTGALTHFTESLQTTGAFTTTNAGVQLLANNATATNIDIALTPKGTGALTAQVADNTASGGDKRGTYAVDWQMARANATEVASGPYSTISGGRNNIASGTYTSIGGGESNSASDVHSTIGGGFTNTAGGEFSTVSGGNTNTANANYSSVGGGQNNTASNLHATIGGGDNNNASGTHSTIAGGQSNTANEQHSTVGGGFSNTASNWYATVAGGNTNVASGNYSTSGGGQDNTASGTHSTISGGRSNTASGAHSTIAGGRGLTLSASGSFGFLGGNNGSNDMSIATNNTAVFGNTDLWLANNDDAASELRFYEAQSSNGAFPGGTTNYTAFRAGTQSVDITYTLPTAAPTAGQILSSDASGNMSWVTAGGGLQYFTEERNTAVPNDVVPVHQLAAIGTETDIDIAITPKGNGALTAQVADDAETGGNKRGTYAVDWQMERGNATQVASGNYSTIAGGQNNTANSDYSTVGGGFQNNADNGSTISGGSDNTANLGSTIGGGQNNTADDTFSTISGGSNNTASGLNSTIGGGDNNTASGASSVIAGGRQNQATDESATIGGGENNTASGIYSTVSGGNNNIANGTQSAIPGGTGMTLDANANNSFGFNGGNNNMIISDARTAVFANVDLWLANNDDTPRSLRFYEQYNNTGAFPNTANYVAFRAANTMAADVTYTLPAADGTNGQVLSTNGSGILSWTNTLSSTTGAALNVGESGSASGFLAVKSELVGNSQTPANGYGVYRITSAPAGNVTLPGVGTAGKLLYVINASGGNVTINIAGGTFVISNNRASSFISDGTNWFPVQN
ncbi:MAG: beta strand repeat-containing protein, partial [Candidatus Kapaibacterium sp.]